MSGDIVHNSTGMFNWLNKLTCNIHNMSIINGARVTVGLKQYQARGSVVDELQLHHS